MNGSVLVDLTHLRGTTEVNYEFNVANQLRERDNAPGLVFFNLGFQQMELLPCFFIYLKVKLLLTAYLIELQ